MPTGRLPWLLFPCLLLTGVGLAGCADSSGPSQAPAAPKASADAGSTVDSRPFALRLHPDGSVTRRGDEDALLAGDTLKTALVEWRRRDAGAFGVASAEGEEGEAGGPELTIDCSDDASHGALETLLRQCVESGVSRFYLRGDSLPAGLSFTLEPPAPAEGLGGNGDALPAMRLKLEADDAGQLTRIALNDDAFADLPAVQARLIELLTGDDVPASLQEMAELEIDGPPQLLLRHVLLAMAAVSGYDDREGLRRMLVPVVRPVVWQPTLAE